jgi:hypothetical protein
MQGHFSDFGKDKDEPAPKPQPSSPPPKPPRGPTVVTGFSGEEEPENKDKFLPRKEATRINLPPKATGEPNIKLPTLPPAEATQLPVLPPGGVTVTTKVPAGSKKRPWWKFR